jgi:hypothetical protein
VWAATDGKMVYGAELPLGAINSVALSPDGKLLALAWYVSILAARIVCQRMMNGVAASVGSAKWALIGSQPMLLALSQPASDLGEDPYLLGRSPSRPRGPFCSTLFQSFSAGLSLILSSVLVERRILASRWPDADSPGLDHAAVP